MMNNHKDHNENFGLFHALIHSGAWDNTFEKMIDHIDHIYEAVFFRALIHNGALDDPFEKMIDHIDHIYVILFFHVLILCDTWELGGSKRKMRTGHICNLSAFRVLF